MWVGQLMLRDGLPARDAPGIPGGGDDVLEDGVLGQGVEEVFSVHEPAQSLGDDPEERGERLETRPVTGAPPGGPRRVRCGGQSPRSWPAESR